jgi:hypothetical protein
MNEPQLKDQRKAARKRITGDLPVRDINSDSSLLGYLVDISTEGLMVVGEAPVPVNGLFQIDIELPTTLNGTRVLRLGVECLWCRNADDPDRFWAGFHLIDISPDDQRTLEALTAAL